MTVTIGWIDLLFVVFLLAVAYGIRRAVLDTIGPIDMVLHCPRCGQQHIDAPEPAPAARHYDELPGGMAETQPWTNPPHRTHLCDHCGYYWRPADVPTNGVLAVRTRGRNDSPLVTTDWNRT